MKKIVLIPSRLQSERLPEKPLKLIGNKTMINLVYEAAIKSVADKTVIATDSELIFNEVVNFGGDVQMTNADHTNGTERIYEASLNLGLNDNDVVINLQGDEPFTDPNDINQIFNLFQDDKVEMVSMFSDVNDKRDLVDPNKVKVVLQDSLAQNFYRYEIEPYKSSFIHLGIYGFKFSTLETIVNLPRSENEIKMRLEQMRALDNDIPIHMIKSNAKMHLGIDTPADLKLANELIKNAQ